MEHTSKDIIIKSRKVELSPIKRKLPQHIQDEIAKIDLNREICFIRLNKPSVYLNTIRRCISEELEIFVMELISVKPKTKLVSVADLTTHLRLLPITQKYTDKTFEVSVNNDSDLDMLVYSDIIIQKYPELTRWNAPLFTLCAGEKTTIKFNIRKMHNHAACRVATILHWGESDVVEEKYLGKKDIELTENSFIIHEKSKGKLLNYNQIPDNSYDMVFKTYGNIPLYEIFMMVFDSIIDRLKKVTFKLIKNKSEKIQAYVLLCSENVTIMELLSHDDENITYKYINDECTVYVTLDKPLVYLHRMLEKKISDFEDIKEAIEK